MQQEGGLFCIQTTALPRWVALTPPRPPLLLTRVGVSHGIDLCCRQLASPGDVILVERPTYFLLQPIIDQVILAIVTVVCLSQVSLLCHFLLQPSIDQVGASRHESAGNIFYPA